MKAAAPIIDNILIFNTLFIPTILVLNVMHKGKQNLVEKNVRKCNKVEKYFIILQNISKSGKMAGFFGKFTAKIDDKGRVVIPSAIKNAVPADQLEFIIRKDMYKNCLEMYTRQEWAEMSQNLRSKLDLLFNEEHMEYWRTHMSGTVLAVPDPKIGRISIPKELLQECGIVKEVVFQCLDFKVEIWAKEDSRCGKMDSESYRDMGRKMAGLL